MLLKLLAILLAFSFPTSSTLLPQSHTHFSISRSSRTSKKLDCFWSFMGAPGTRTFLGLLIGLTFANLLVILASPLPTAQESAPTIAIQMTTKATLFTEPPSAQMPLCGEWYNRIQFCAPVAQWIEHRTSNPVVVGSSPTGRASFEGPNESCYDAPISD